MTTTDFTLNDTAITVYQNGLEETITYNGKSVSQKSALFGTRHEFVIENDNYEVITAFDYAGRWDNKVQFRKNGKLLEEKRAQASFLTQTAAIILLLAATFLLIGLF
ncbi:hypothetical protein Q763_08755 [Flavobacterium beibuense F44-8]|uniref:Uncharacterized protein n=1 Tax=Flavobacterium beibuense F44-8 TaxID=1406840 RepID=A0A0A2LLN8_9FLAO|nr:hypothetical protein [Flavobacterium beibuense]KGO81162.1 hypothetical protein Q763_08755 [Flavobacterium beibuense F44-8]